MRLRRRPASKPTLVADPCLGDPGARRFCGALEDRDWPTARAVLAAAEHPDDRAFYLQACGAVPDVQLWIGHLASDDELAQLVRGAHAVAWAWNARGGRSSEYTDAGRFQVFFERLRLAESYLYDVVDRNPDEVSAWAFLIRSGRGLQLPLADGEYRYGEVAKRFPGHWKANFEWMQTLCARSGSAVTSGCTSSRATPRLVAATEVCCTASSRWHTSRSLAASRRTRPPRT